MADKGLFVTTGTVTRDAAQEARFNIDMRHPKGYNAS